MCRCRCFKYIRTRSKGGRLVDYQYPQERVAILDSLDL